MLVVSGNALGVRALRLEVTPPQAVKIHTNWLDPATPANDLRTNDWGFSKKSWKLAKEGGFTFHQVGLISSKPSFPYGWNYWDPVYDGSLRFADADEPKAADDKDVEPGYPSGLPMGRVGGEPRGERYSWRNGCDIVAE